jgi:predicted TIM-barrel fold metal-dependent hydrolase
MTELPKTIDIHVHLAGVGAGGSGCFVSDRMKRSVVYHYMRWKLKMDPDDPDADDRYGRELAAHVAGSANVDAAVVFAMDGVYDDAGSMVRGKSHLYVPNEHMFAVCRRHPELLPGASVNPMRPDALEELARIDEAGAVLIKWLAPLQGMNPADRKLDVFYEEMARRGIPLLAHSGCEHTFPGCDHNLGHADIFRRALEIGLTLILAHCGKACPVHRAHDQTRIILRMMEEFPRLHADTSALASPLKFPHLKKVPFRDFPGRFLHGSDYPIPTLPLPFIHYLGVQKTLELMRAPNPIEIDWQIKSAAGQTADAFTSASWLLRPRIEKWLALNPRS